MNIEYIYERASNPTLKRYYVKYLNQNFFYPTLKKHNFFLVNIENIYKRASNHTLKK